MSKLIIEAHEAKGIMARIRSLPRLLTRHKEGRLKRCSEGFYELYLEQPITFWDKVLRVDRPNGYGCSTRLCGDDAETVECIQFRLLDLITMRYTDCDFRAQIILKGRGITDLRYSLPAGVYWRPGEKSSNWFNPDADFEIAGSKSIPIVPLSGGGAP